MKKIKIISVTLMILVTIETIALVVVPVVFYFSLRNWSNTLNKTTLNDINQLKTTIKKQETNINQIKKDYSKFDKFKQNDNKLNQNPLNQVLELERTPQGVEFIKYKNKKDPISDWENSSESALIPLNKLKKCFETPFKIINSLNNKVIFQVPDYATPFIISNGTTGKPLWFCRAWNPNDETANTNQTEVLDTEGIPWLNFNHTNKKLESSDLKTEAKDIIGAINQLLEQINKSS